MTITLPDPGASHRSDSAEAEGGVGPRPADFRSSGPELVPDYVRAAASDPGHWYWSRWLDDARRLEDALWLLSGVRVDLAWDSATPNTAAQRVESASEAVRLVGTVKRQHLRGPVGARVLAHAQVCAARVQWRVELMRAALAAGEVPRVG